MKVKLNVTKKSIYKGKKYTLKISGTKKKVKWFTSNKKIATVSSKGIVTAKKVGNCYIYAKVSGKKLRCKVTVKNKPKSYIVSLKANKTYYQYDITGDGKKDKLKIVPQIVEDYGSYYTIGEKVIVYINNKKSNLYSDEYSYSMKFKIIYLNNKPFLLINGYSKSDYDSWQILYQYKKGKLVKMYDLKRMTSKYGYHPEAQITKVSSNKIYVNHFIVSNSLGCVTFDYVYQYKNGKIYRTSSNTNVSWNGQDVNTYKPVKYGTMSVTKTTYTSPTSNKKKGTIKKGVKVKPIKIYMNDKKMYIQLKTKSGQTGWVKGSKSISSEPLMKECLFVG